MPNDVIHALDFVNFLRAGKANRPGSGKGLDFFGPIFSLSGGHLFGIAHAFQLFSYFFIFSFHFI